MGGGRGGEGKHSHFIIRLGLELCWHCDGNGKVALQLCQDVIFSVSHIAAERERKGRQAREHFTELFGFTQQTHLLKSPCGANGKTGTKLGGQHS